MLLKGKFEPCVPFVREQGVLRPAKRKGTGTSIVVRRSIWKNRTAKGNPIFARKWAEVYWR